MKMKEAMEPSYRRSSYAVLKAAAAKIPIHDDAGEEDLGMK
jgi:hypothetical protein